RETEDNKDAASDHSFPSTLPIHLPISFLSNLRSTSLSNTQTKNELSSLVLIDIQGECFRTVFDQETQRFSLWPCDVKENSKTHNSSEKMHSYHDLDIWASIEWTEEMKKTSFVSSETPKRESSKSLDNFTRSPKNPIFHIGSHSLEGEIEDLKSSEEEIVVLRFIMSPLERKNSDEICDDSGENNINHSQQYKRNANIPKHLFHKFYWEVDAFLDRILSFQRAPVLDPEKIRKLEKPNYSASTYDPIKLQNIQMKLPELLLEDGKVGVTKPCTHGKNTLMSSRDQVSIENAVSVCVESLADTASHEDVSVTSDGNLLSSSTKLGSSTCFSPCNIPSADAPIPTKMPIEDGSNSLSNTAKTHLKAPPPFSSSSSSMSKPVFMKTITSIPEIKEIWKLVLSEMISIPEYTWRLMKVDKNVSTSLRNGNPVFFKGLNPHIRDGYPLVLCTLTTSYCVDKNELDGDMLLALKFDKSEAYDSIEEESNTVDTNFHLSSHEPKVLGVPIVGKCKSMLLLQRICGFTHQVDTLLQSSEFKEMGMSTDDLLCLVQASPYEIVRFLTGIDAYSPCNSLYFQGRWYYVETSTWYRGMQSLLDLATLGDFDFSCIENLTVTALTHSLRTILASLNQAEASIAFDFPYPMVEAVVYQILRWFCYFDSPFWRAFYNYCLKDHSKSFVTKEISDYNTLSEVNRDVNELSRLQKKIKMGQNGVIQNQFNKNRTFSPTMASNSSDTSQSLPFNTEERETSSEFHYSELQHSPMRAYEAFLESPQLLGPAHIIFSLPRIQRFVAQNTFMQYGRRQQMLFNNLTSNGANSTFFLSYYDIALKEFLEKSEIILGALPTSLLMDISLQRGKRLNTSYQHCSLPSYASSEEVSSLSSSMKRNRSLMEKEDSFSVFLHSLLSKSKFMCCDCRIEEGKHVSKCGSDTVVTSSTSKQAASANSLRDGIVHFNHLKECTVGFPDLRECHRGASIDTPLLCAAATQSLSSEWEKEFVQSSAVKLINFSIQHPYSIAWRLSLLRGLCFFVPSTEKLIYLPQQTLPHTLRERLISLFLFKDYWYEEELFYYLRTLLDGQDLVAMISGEPYNFCWSKIKTLSSISFKEDESLTVSDDDKVVKFIRWNLPLPNWNV
ncbi:hypothetical protein IE077_003013, partial [Cardiosporidium cionae]